MKKRKITRAMLARAAEAAVVAGGGPSELSSKLGDITSQAVSSWRRKKVPAIRVKQVSLLTGIPKHELRPDIYDVGD